MNSIFLKALIFVFLISSPFNFLFSNSSTACTNLGGFSCITLIEESEACSIYMLEDEDGNVYYQVIAAVATAWLPEIVEGFCERTIGDPDICNAVYDVTSMIVTLRGRSIYSGITRGLKKNLRWIANRGYDVSKATIEARTYNIASGIKTVFELYREKCNRGNGIPWKRIDNKKATSEFNSSYHSFHTYQECKFATIIGNRVNFRTTPSIETYNKIQPQLVKGQKVSVIGHQIPMGGKNMRLVMRSTKFYYGDNENFIIEKGIAVEYVGTYNSAYDLVLLNMKDGTRKKGVIKRSYLTGMDNKTWYKIRANGRTGWVYEDFIYVD